MKTTLDQQLVLRLDRETSRAMALAARQAGVSKSDFVRDAIRKEILLRRFDALCAEFTPKARAMGIFTDEDAFKLMEDMT